MINFKVILQKYFPYSPISVPNFTIQYPYWINIACFRKVNCYYGCNKYYYDP